MSVLCEQEESNLMDKGNKNSPKNLMKSTDHVDPGGLKEQLDARCVPSSPLLRLSDDLNQQILQYLNHVDLINMEQTSRAYRRRICPAAWRFWSETWPSFQSVFGDTPRERCRRYFRVQSFARNMEHAARTHWQHPDIEQYVMEHEEPCQGCQLCLPQMEGTYGETNFRALLDDADEVEWYVRISLPHESNQQVIWEGFGQPKKTTNTALTKRLGELNLYFGPDSLKSNPSFQQMIQDIETEGGAGPFQDWVGKHSFTVVSIAKRPEGTDSPTPMCRLIRVTATGGVIGTGWKRITRGERRIYSYSITTLPNSASPHPVASADGVHVGGGGGGRVGSSLLSRLRLPQLQENSIGFSVGMELTGQQQRRPMDVLGAEQIVPYLSFELNEA